jgi:YYY domain-containing protein
LLSVAQWYLWSQLLLLPSLPIALLIFRRLPDRGYPLAKSLGLLLPAFLLWLAASLHLLPNTSGSLLLLWGLLLGAGLLVVWRCWGEVSAFFRQQRGTVLATELLFLAAFLLWAVVRAYNPDIQYAEKPMDIGLLNAVLRNRFFPPADPWLSGVTVNYYYFGFVAASLPLRLSGLAPAVGYNLYLALFFALTALGAFSLVFNLVRLAGARWRVGLWLGLAGVGLLLLAANMEGVLEFVYSRGWGGEGFWRWVGIAGMETPYASTAWHPTDGVWWWRATRVIGFWTGGVQVDNTITEFPFFSFLFGDLHAHIMVMPFHWWPWAWGWRCSVPPRDGGLPG